MKQLTVCRAVSMLPVPVRPDTLETETSARPSTNVSRRRTVAAAISQNAFSPDQYVELLLYVNVI